MLSNDERRELHKLRDEIEDPEDKKLLRKAITHIEEMEDVMQTVRTLVRTMERELKRR